MRSLDCALLNVDLPIPMIYLRLVYSQILPCIYILIFVIGLTVKYLVSKKKGKFPTYVMFTAVIFLVIYVQPDLVAQSMALISCREIGGTLYILSNVSFECFTEDYNYYSNFLVIPVLTMWALIIPLLLFVKIKINQDNLQDPQVKLRYGYLYKEYKVSGYYWEFVKIAEKLVIIVCLNFYSQSIVTKGILMFIIIVIYGILAQIIQPYKEDQVNTIDVHSTNVCAITVILGVFIYKNSYDYFTYIAFILIILINLWYLFSMLEKIIHGYLLKFRRQILTLVRFLSKKIKFFSRFDPNSKPKGGVNDALKIKIRNLMRTLANLDPYEKKQLYIDLCMKNLEANHKQIFLSSKQNSQQDEGDLKMSKKESVLIRSQKSELDNSSDTDENIDNENYSEGFAKQPKLNVEIKNAHVFAQDNFTSIKQTNTFENIPTSPQNDRQQLNSSIFMFSTEKAFEIQSIPIP